MLANSALTHGVVASGVAAAAFLVIIAALLVERSRLRRRLFAVERSEALLETDLSDARRDLDRLRELLRDHTRGTTPSDQVSNAGSVPGDPAAPLG